MTSLRRLAPRLAPLLLLLPLGCSDDPAKAPTTVPDDDSAEAFSGGVATVFDTTHDAFSHPVPDLTPDREDAFFVGNSIFNRSWVTAPASVADMDGLGPIYNAKNCSGCHFKDGRGRPPETADEPFSSMLIRLSVPGANEHGGPTGEPTYGGQLQGASILGVDPEGTAKIRYDEAPGAYGDGAAFSLRRPTYTIENLSSGPMRPDVMMSPRVAPQMVGLGLLEAVPEAAIVALADPDDADGDGISGRPNRVWDATAGQVALGRFGWKANQPSLRQQVLGAFNGDMGITSSLFPADDCTEAQASCRSAKSGGSPELLPAFAESVISYSSTLAVPARRQWRDPGVRRGQALFGQIACGTCHTPELHTGVSDAFPELSNQLIRPYTDLLLHDMGPDLADNRPDFEASGTEWRTPPLWGIGLFKTVNRHTYYLHDGRARSLEEAVLWHGGEGQASRDAFVALPAADRAALLSFLESL